MPPSSRHNKLASDLERSLVINALSREKLPNMVIMPVTRMKQYNALPYCILKNKLQIMSVITKLLSSLCETSHF